MHVADIDGRIYERRKLERKRQFVFAAWCVLFGVAVVMLLCMGGN